MEPDQYVIDNHNRQGAKALKVLNANYRKLLQEYGGEAPEAYILSEMLGYCCPCTSSKADLAFLKSVRRMAQSLDMACDHVIEMIDEAVILEEEACFESFMERISGDK